MRKREFRRELKIEFSKWECGLKRKKNSYEEEIEIITERIKYLKDLITKSVPSPFSGESFSGYRLSLDRATAKIRKDGTVEMYLDVVHDGSYEIRVTALVMKIEGGETEEELLQEYFALKDERKRKKKLRQKVMLELEDTEAKRRQLKADLYSTMKGVK